jgi:hypothetical protein
VSVLTLLARAAALAAPARDRDAVLGDLLEEHALLRERGHAAADRWLVSQLARSVAPWFAQRWRAFEVQPLLAAALAAAVAATLGARAGEGLFRYVLDHVPLRAAHAPSAAWLVSFVLLRGAFAVIAAAATLRSFTPRWEGRT